MAGSIVVGQLGRLRKREMIIQAFKQAKEQVPNLKLLFIVYCLLFIGDSEIDQDRQYLLEEDQKLGVADDFIITDWVSIEELGLI